MYKYLYTFIVTHQHAVIVELIKRTAILLTSLLGSLNQELSSHAGHCTSCNVLYMGSTWPPSSRISDTRMWGIGRVDGKCYDINYQLPGNRRRLHGGGLLQRGQRGALALLQDGLTITDDISRSTFSEGIWMTNSAS